MSEAGTTAIRVEQTRQSRLPQVDFNNLKFGQIFSDHMLVADYANGGWQDVRIEPYGDLSLSPATSAIHYGQSIFEGLKAYKFSDGTVSVFRPDQNRQRFNKSATRLEMPALSEELFIGGIKALLDLDRDW